VRFNLHIQIEIFKQTTSINTKIFRRYFNWTQITFLTHRNNKKWTIWTWN